MKIKCRRWQLEERCRERGFSLDEVLPCVVSADGEEWVVDTESPHYPSLPRPGFVYEGIPNIPLTRDITNSPSFVTKVRNFAVATAGHVAAGMPMASDEDIIRRHDICLKCEHLVDNACMQCGCPISRAKGYVSKLSWADQECPVGKWGKVAGKSNIDP